jgi:hypothetical protein
MRGWGRVKLVNKRLQNLKIQLSSQGVNIISIAQMEDVKEKRGEQFVKVGEKPNMAKGVQFDYDTILKLYTEKNSKGEETYKAIIEKDRTGIFKKGEIIENPSFEYWKDYYSKASTLEKRVINFNKDLDNDMKKMQDETDNLEDIIKEFKTLMKELPKENQVKVAKLLKEKGIDNPLKTDNLEAMMEVVDFIKAL